MSSVDEFVRTNILTFPTLFANRTAVLHHALCVIGNGYKWSADGEVVEDGSYPAPLWNKETALAVLDADLKVWFEDEHLRELVGASLRENINATAKVVEEIETRIHERAPIEGIYPQSKEYALLMNIPENVTPEWKAACDEMRELAIAAGWVFSE
jgi:hypothetical protein